MSKRTRVPNTPLRAEEAVRAVLPRAVKVRVAKRNEHADLFVNEQPVEVKWAGEGNLGDVRRLLAECRRRPDIVVARRLSPGAREALNQEGIGWVDETGAAEIAIGSIIVARTGRPPKVVKQLDRWTPAVLAVAEALLCGSTPTVSGIKAAIGLSTGSCTHALRVLTNLGLLETKTKRGPASGRRVSDPDTLLMAYSAAVEAQPTPIRLQVGVPWRDPIAGLANIGKKWSTARNVWAATGAAAASVVAPYLTNVAVAEVYVDAQSIVGLEAIAEDAGLRPIDGGRLTLKPFPTVAVRRLAQQVANLWVAPWPRVYIDLRTAGVRGEEAAEHLREEMRAR